MGALSGQAIIVTGAGRGLGRAYAIEAAAQGASVVVNDVDGAEAQGVAEEIRSRGGSAVASTHSVVSRDAVDDMLDLCEREFGRIDGLVNNAGLIRQGPAWEVTGDDIDALISVNVIGVLHCGHAVLRRLVAQRSGVLINVTSGAHQGMAGLALYGATKGAVASATYGWAIDAAPFGVRVLGISPLGQSRMGTSDRLPKPEAIAPVVAYLLGEGSAGLSGHVIRFDGVNLSVLGRPKIEDPVVSRESWTIDDVRSAFDDHLRARASLVGLGSLDLRSV